MSKQYSMGKSVDAVYRTVSLSEGIDAATVKQIGDRLRREQPTIGSDFVAVLRTKVRARRKNELYRITAI
jgi:hypothetical protein